MSRGKLIVLSGPSGVGKGSVRKEIMNDESLNLTYSISMTTRKPREGEVHGEDYFFVTHDGFLKAIENNELLEYANFVGNFYGTPKNEVERLRNMGKNVFIEIEVSGAKQVIEQIKDKDVITIFLAPPSLEVLEERIRGRQTETEEKIKSRLQRAIEELPYQNLYDHVVINNELALAAGEIKQIINSKMTEK